jgi:hypothetical protein
LFRELFRTGQETQVARIDRDDPLNTAGLLGESLEERGECAIAIVKPVQCSLATAGRGRASASCGPYRYVMSTVFILDQHIESKLFSHLLAL